MASVTATMLRADVLTVVHHDDSESRFTDVSYSLSRDGLLVVSDSGDETSFSGHDVLTTHASRSHE